MGPADTGERNRTRPPTKTSTRHTRNYPTRTRSTPTSATPISTGFTKCSPTYRTRFGHTDTDPFGNGETDGTTDGEGEDTSNTVEVTVDGKTQTLCAQPTVDSNTDDWSGRRPSLAATGAAADGITLAVIAVGALGTGLLLARRRTPRDRVRGAHAGK